MGRWGLDGCGGEAALEGAKILCRDLSDMPCIDDSVAQVS